MAGVSELALAGIYARACPSARLPADLEMRLQAIVARVAQAWPELTIDPARVVEAIARVVGDEVEPGLTDLYVEDLALAVACADGVPNALARCERVCAGAIAAAVARVDRSADLRDEVRQILWQRIFVGTTGKSPRIQSYVGRGPAGGLGGGGGAAGGARSPAVGGADDGRAIRGPTRFSPPINTPRSTTCGPGTRPSSRRRCARRSPACPIAIACCCKLTIVSGLSHEQLANIYSVNQSTITRWIARAREQVLDATEREVCSQAGDAARRVSLAGGPPGQPPRPQHLARARHPDPTDDAIA